MTIFSLGVCTYKITTYVHTPNLDIYKYLKTITHTKKGTVIQVLMFPT